MRLSWASKEPWRTEDWSLETGIYRLYLEQKVEEQTQEIHTLFISFLDAIAALD
jgi:hypothetical protein